MSLVQPLKRAFYAAADRLSQPSPEELEARFVEAVRFDDPKILRILIKKYRLNPDFIHIPALESTDTYSAACYCAMAGYNRSLQVLLDCGANPDLDISLRPAPPLVVAASSGNVEGGKILLQALATVDAQAFDGDSALHVAARADDIPFIKLLTNAGANVHLRNNRKTTPVKLARNNRNDEAVTIMLRANEFNRILDAYESDTSTKLLSAPLDEAKLMEHKLAAMTPEDRKTALKVIVGSFRKEIDAALAPEEISSPKATSGGPKIK